MSTHAAPDEPLDRPDTPPPGPVTRLGAKLLAPFVRVRAHPRIAIAVVAAGRVAAASVTVWMVLRPSKAEQAARAAEAALEFLDGGDFDQAKKQAEVLRADTEASDQRAVASFVLGVVSAKEAGKANAAAKKALFLVAARYLEDALRNGLPDERAGQAEILLGRSLYEAGRMKASRVALDRALASQPQRSAEIRRLLAASYVDDREPNLAEALRENGLLLALDNLPPAVRSKAFLQKAEILDAMGKPKECLAALANVPSDAEEARAATVLKGRALLSEVRALKAKPMDPNRHREAQEKLQAALAAVRDTSRLDPGQGISVRQAGYVMGACLLESGDTRGALEYFVRLRKLAPNTPEGLAAAFQEGNLCWSQGRRAEAAAAYCCALEAVGPAGESRNPWVSLEQLRKRALEAYQQDLEARRFSQCVEIARRMGAATSPERALQLQAEAHRAWGRDLAARAAAAQPAKAAPLEKEGRFQLRRASRLWEQLAKLRLTTRHYTEDLWEGATCALEGRDYRGAVRMFEEYLKHEQRARHAQALVGLGESLLCVGSVDEAIVVFRRCMDLHSRDVVSLKARLLASQARVDKGDLPAAQRLLEENLNGESLTPASREYRESLLALGRLLHRAKRYEEAIRRLEEVVNRYGGSRQAVEARYLIADCHRRWALEEEAKLRQDLVEQSRSARFRRIRDSLTAALGSYRQTQEALLKCQETAELTPLEKRMLRNTYYLIGSVLAGLGQSDEAVKAFTAAVSRYPNAPATLDAHVQLAWAYRAANRPGDARGSIEQARLLLARLKPDAPFLETTNYTKEQWAARLDREAGSVQ